MNNETGLNEISTPRVLQVNIDDAGGAFSLMFQLQKQLKGTMIFDYYSMANFRYKEIVDQIESMGGKVQEARLRSNRLLGHIILPFKFYHFLAENNYSVIHIHADTAWKLLLYAIPAKKRGTRRIIVHAHSSNVNGDFKGVKYICHLISKPILPLFVTDLVTCSDKATSWMFPSHLYNITTKIHNGVDLHKFAFDSSDRKRVRESLGIEEGEVLIGTVGDFSYSKNPYFLIEVLNKLVNDCGSLSNYRLLFIGEGTDRASVEEYVRKLGLNERVLIYGKAKKITELYSSMDIFAMPSRFEGLPVSAIEAQVSGLECLLSNSVTQETKCIDNCFFLGLNDTGEWVDKIKNFIPYTDRKLAWKKVKEAGYGIEDTAFEILRLYKR